MANEPTQAMEEELPQPSPKKSKFKSKRFLLLFVVPLDLIAGSIVLYLHGGRYVETENAYVKADKTPINAEVAGRVINVPVEENRHVKKGDLLSRSILPLMNMPLIELKPISLMYVPNWKH